MKKRKNFDFKIHRIKTIDEKTFSGKENKVAVIFCSCYPNRLKRCEYAMNWLTMEFSGENKKFFTENHAELIKKFIDTLPLQINEIHICTDRGESRATAIMAAVMRYFGYNDKKVWRDYHYHPDTVVYKTLCKTLGVFMPEITVRYKKRMNEKSFENLIKERRTNI